MENTNDLYKNINVGPSDKPKINPCVAHDFEEDSTNANPCVSLDFKDIQPSFSHSSSPESMVGKKVLFNSKFTNLTFNKYYTPSRFNEDTYNFWIYDDNNNERILDVRNFSW